MRDVPLDDDPPPRGSPRLMGSMAGFAEGQQKRHHCLSMASKCKTPGQRKRLLRNVIMAAAHRQGVSQRVLAEFFDLARSRVAEAIEEIEGK